MASSKSKVTLKLLIDNKASKVLFAEADKAFVDFLFTIMTLPIGTVTSLLKKEMVGSLGTLYQSIESLSNSYTVSDHSKEVVLHPKVALSSQASISAVPLLGYAAGVACKSSDPLTLFMCWSCSSTTVTDEIYRTCSSCGDEMSQQVTLLSQSTVATRPTTKSSDGGGFVKDVVTYMVMDDLAVKPMSAISSITMLNTFNITDVSSLEERTVSITMPEGLKLLGASMRSKTVLTDVFLHQTI